MAVDRIHIFSNGEIGHYTDNTSLLVLVPDRKPDECPISGRKQVPVFITTFIIINKKGVETFEKGISKVITELKERFIR